MKLLVWDHGSYVIWKKAPSQHPGCLPFPAHLRRKTVVIEPSFDTTGMVCIGEAVTETLELVEARFFVYREVRPKYREQTDAGEQIHVAALPDRPFPKLGAGVSVWVQILLSKYVDHVLPKSLIGKALGYYLKRKDKLSAYTQDGRWEIDNNYVENTIRPLALGRKNYLFAGSHQGARWAAMMYAFLGSCEKCQIEPRQWLTDVLYRIAQHPVNRLEELLPHQWQPHPDLAPAQRTVICRSVLTHLMRIPQMHLG